jgi:hypothetical protein
VLLSLSQVDDIMSHDKGKTNAWFSPSFAHRWINPEQARSLMEVKARDPVRRTIWLSAITAWEKAAMGPTVTECDLAPIVAAARHSEKWLATTCIDMLFLMAQVHEEARDAIDGFLRDRLKRIRERCIVQMHFWCFKNLPRVFVKKILGMSLEDKAYKVRLFAAESVFRYWRRDMLPALEEKLCIETDARVKGMLEYCIPLLRDGYFVENHPKWGPQLTFFFWRRRVNDRCRQGQDDRQGS